MIVLSLMQKSDLVITKDCTKKKQKKRNMINYIALKNGGYYEGLVKFDTDTLEVSSVKRTYANIRDIYIVTEDGVFNDKEVHKGDLVCVMYRIGNNAPETIVVTDDVLKDYYTRLISFEEEQNKLREECSDNCCGACCSKD